MRPVEFGEALPPGTRLTLFSDDKPDRFFTVIEFSIDKTLGAAFNFEAGIPSYRVQDEKAEFICSSICRLTKNVPTNGGFGGRIKQLWVQNQFFRGH
jgi:hypothetical protein